MFSRFFTRWCGVLLCAAHLAVAAQGASENASQNTPQNKPQKPAPQAITVVDDRGKTVHFDVPPQRIVSLLPSLTESVCALGACARLVGVDRYSRYPDFVRQLPVLGGGLDPQIEGVLARKPDVVLVSVSTRAAQRLESLGLKVVALDPRARFDVQRTLQVLENLLQVPAVEGPGAAKTAAQVWQRIEDGVHKAAASLPPQAKNARVYFEISPGPYAAGPEGFIGQIMASLGLQNIIAPELGAFPRISPEFVLRAKPDVMMITHRGSGAPFQYPGWQRLPAIQAGRVCVFDAAQSDVLVRPGPRLDEAAALIADCVARALEKLEKR